MQCATPGAINTDSRGNESGVMARAYPRKGHPSQASRQSVNSPQLSGVVPPFPHERPQWWAYSRRADYPKIPLIP